MLRHRFTTGSYEAGVHRSADEDDLADNLLDVVNICWSDDAFGHCCYKPGCCDGQQKSVCVERMTALLVRAVLDRLGARIPAQNRWHTLSPTMCTQGLGVMLCRYLPRLMQALSEVDEAPAEHDIPDWRLSYREYCTKKSEVARVFLSDMPATGMLLAVACCVTEAPERLSARLQSADETGHSMHEMLMRDGPLQKCQQHLYYLLQPDDRAQAGDGPATRSSRHVGAILHHFEQHIPRQEILDELQRTSIAISAICWSRIELLCNSLPMFPGMARTRSRPAAVLMELSTGLSAAARFVEIAKTYL